jgi:hypothetical protein
MGRKEFKEVLLSGVADILKTDKEVLDHNIGLISKLIDGMTDKELEALVDDIENKKSLIPLVVPNGSTIDYEDLLAVANKRKVKLHKKIITTDGNKRTKGRIARLVMEVPVKKLAQLVDKKRSIADDQHSVNHLTGQVTGASKSMSITNPELSLWAGNGMHDSTKECTKYRGGDVNSKIVIEKLAESGMEITQETLERYSSGPEVNNTVKQLLLGMHIDATIGVIKK